MKTGYDCVKTILLYWKECVPISDFNFFQAIDTLASALEYGLDELRKVHRFIYSTSLTQ